MANPLLDTTKRDAEGNVTNPEAPSNDDALAAAQAAQAAAAAKAQQDALNNHYNYGGYAGGASQAADFYQKKAAQDQDRPGVQINYGNAGIQRQNSINDRGALVNTGNSQYNIAGQQAGLVNNQLGLADLLRRRAMGQMPSIAQMQADRSNQQVAAEQSSAAASARGPAALALAQQQAAGNTANAQSNISNQAQINGAQEQLNNTTAAGAAYNQAGSALGAAAGTYGQAGNTFQGLRQGDLQGQAQDAQQAQAQAAQDAQQRALNDQGFASNSDRAVGINTTQLQAQGNQISTATGAQIAQNQLNQQASQHSDDRTDKYIGYGVGAAAGVGGALLAATLGGTGGGSSSPAGVTSPGQPTPQPGAPAGFDPATGAPVPSQGGGYDPTKPDSDERAKVPTTWGNVVADADPRDAPSTWGGGPGTSHVDMSAMLARRALDEQSARESRANPLPQQGMHSTGPQAVAGMEALRRRDAEDYGLILAKERNGAPLTEKEQATKFALRRRVATDDQALRGRPQVPMAAQHHGSELARNVGTELGGIGRAMIQSSSGGGTHYASVNFNPQQQQLGGRRVDSDMTTKHPEPMPAVGGTAPAHTADAALVAAQNRLLAQQNANAAMLGMGPSVGGSQPSVALPPPIATMPAQQQAQLAQPPAVQGAIDRANTPYQGPMDSDDRTKLAAAWDQGHAAAIQDVQKLGSKRPEDLRTLSDSNPLAAAVRTSKADAHDEGRLAGAMGVRHDQMAVAHADMDRAAAESEARMAARRSERQDPNTPAAPASSYGPQEAAPQQESPSQWSLADMLRRSRAMLSDKRTKDIDAPSGGGRGDDGRVNTPMANASRSMEGQPYTYKPEFAARNGQQPGEKQVGPMAQNMAADPVARLVVGTSPDTGTLNLDTHKLMKLTASGVAEQQRQNDEQDRLISIMARRLGMKR